METAFAENKSAWTQATSLRQFDCFLSIEARLAPFESWSMTDVADAQALHIKDRLPEVSVMILKCTIGP